VGALFLVSGGTGALGGLLGLAVSPGAQMTAQGAAGRLGAQVPDLVLLAAVGVLVLLAGAWRLRRRSAEEAGRRSEGEPGRR
jgi:hypothetical protein